MVWASMSVFYNNNYNVNMNKSTSITFFLLIYASVKKNQIILKLLYNINLKHVWYCDNDCFSKCFLFGNTLK